MSEFVVQKSTNPRTIWGLLQTSTPVLVSLAVFSAVINVLALSGAIYMLQIYDRVIPSTSVPTLVGLSVVLVLLYAVLGTLDVVRARIMSRIGAKIDATLGPKVFSAMVRRSGEPKSMGDGLQPVRDLDQIRHFLSGAGPTALLDLPWIPIFLIFVYLLHPALALLAAIGATVLLLLTALTEWRSAAPMQSAAASSSQRLGLAQAVRRNGDSIQAMGFEAALAARYRAISDSYLKDQLAASDAVNGIGNFTKVARLLLQSAVLGFGAYLVINQELSAGGIIAASITVARSLAPIESAIANWRGFVAARQSAERLGVLLDTMDVAPDVHVELPAPVKNLSVERLILAAPGETMPILKNIGFELQAGDGLGIIGPSGSGKTTLARALIGLWKPAPTGGAIRLDGASLDQWQTSQLGRHVGYMSQDTELMSGTIGENISRFDPNPTGEKIVSAAKNAGAHDTITGLKGGYQVLVGDSGRQLSGGERQRVALARALYDDPFLVVLDEPNANLDAAGEAALTNAILSVRRRGGIAVVIAHRPSALAGVNKVLVMSDGTARAFGPRDEVLKSVLKSVPPNATGGAGGDLQASNASPTHDFGNNTAPSPEELS